jgi:hydroxymethylbilane synthase
VVVAAVPERASPFDMLVRRDVSLPAGARVGSSSLRRRGQLRAARPDLEVVEIRGNVDTRLRKRRERRLDAIVLAACGLDRLGLTGEIGRRFEPRELLPEAAQGALALQVRAADEALVYHADDPETRRRVEAERACVAAIGGGCLAPVAAHHDGRHLTALIADENGAWLERRTGDDPADLARELLAAAHG